MKIIRTWFKPQPNPSIINEAPSLTVPNMSMTPQEILLRFARGQSVPQFPISYLGEEIEAPDFKTMDILEQKMFIDNLNEDINTKTQKVQDLKDQLAKRIKDEESKD